MEIFALVVIAVLFFSKWKSANLATDRHQEISDDLVLIRNSIIEIKSGVANKEGVDLNPNLFDVPHEVTEIVGKKMKLFLN